MSDGKNALKLPADHIDFNLNLKLIRSPLVPVPETFDFLVSFDIFVRHEIQGNKKIEIQGDKKIEITSQKFHFAIH